MKSNNKTTRRNFLKHTAVTATAITATAAISVSCIKQQKHLSTEPNKMPIKHRCKITVLRKELYSDLQEQYLADPKSGKCPYFHEGQEFIVENEDFFRMLNGKFCSEAWDCISRYVYTALQGGSIMRGWTNDEKVMITCCNDGTRPVIFKLERIDE